MPEMFEVTGFKAAAAEARGVLTTAKAAISKTVINPIAIGRIFIVPLESSGLGAHAMRDAKPANGRRHSRKFTQMSEMERD